MSSGFYFPNKIRFTRYEFSFALPAFRYIYTLCVIRTYAIRPYIFLFLFYAIRNTRYCFSLDTVFAPCIYFLLYSFLTIYSILFYMILTTRPKINPNNIPTRKTVVKSLALVTSLTPLILIKVKVTRYATPFIVIKKGQTITLATIGPI